MIKITQKYDRGLELKLSGAITASDYKQVIPELDRLIEEHGGFNLLVDLTDASGITISAIWEDLKFDVKHFRTTRRCALIANDKMDWIATLSEPFVSIEAKSFSPEEIAQARSWAFSLDQNRSEIHAETR